MTYLPLCNPTEIWIHQHFNIDDDSLLRPQLSAPGWEVEGSWVWPRSSATWTKKGLLTWSSTSSWTPPATASSRRASYWPSLCWRGATRSSRWVLVTGYNRLQLVTTLQSTSGAEESVNELQRSHVQTAIRWDSWQLFCTEAWAESQQEDVISRVQSCAAKNLSYSPGAPPPKAEQISGQGGLGVGKRKVLCCQCSNGYI